MCHAYSVAPSYTLFSHIQFENHDDDDHHHVHAQQVHEVVALLPFYRRKSRLRGVSVPSFPTSSLSVSGLSSLAAQSPPHVPIAPVCSKVHATTLTPFGDQMGPWNEKELCTG